MHTYAFLRLDEFQSTLPSREGTVLQVPLLLYQSISIHPSLAGRDLSSSAGNYILPDFNPPFPRGKGLNSCLHHHHIAHFNPPFPRGKGPCHQCRQTAAIFISIHPSLAGRDTKQICLVQSNGYFNPPFPRGKGLAPFPGNKSFFKFQSTLPSREGTEYTDFWNRLRNNFNPPFPRGKGQNGQQIRADTESISIHPSLAGRDYILITVTTFVKNFNPPFPRGKGL